MSNPIHEFEGGNSAGMNAAYRGAGTASGYRRPISTEVAAHIREWHDAALRAATRGDGTDQTFAYLGNTLTVPPDVHQITGVSHLLGEAVLAEVGDDDHVLDMGTGSGVNAILAASRGAHVVAVDIHPHARDVAYHNVDRSGLTDRIEIRRSDLFTEVSGQFDVIIYEPQVSWRAPTDLLEFIGAIEDKRTLTSFIRRARQYLTEMRGRILFFVGPSPDLANLIDLAAEERYATDVIAQEALITNGRSVDHFAIRLTPSAHDEGD